MSNSFRRALAFLFAVVALFSFLSTRLAAESVKDLPRPQNYVSDFAGVLSPQTVFSLDQLCAAVDHQANAQIAVVTIRSLDDVPIEDFATQLEDKWGVGPKKNDRGILLILAIQDHKRRIEVGYGLEGVITDEQAGEIGRAMVPDLKSGSYDGAVTLAVGQIANKIAAAAGVTLQASPRPVRVARPMTLGQLIWIAIIFLLVIFFVARTGGSGLVGFLIGMFLGGGGGGGGGGNDDEGGGFGGFGGGSSGGGGASGDW